MTSLFIISTTRVSFIFFHLLSSSAILFSTDYNCICVWRGRTSQAYGVEILFFDAIAVYAADCERLKITSLAGRGCHTPVISQAVYRASQPLGGLDLFLHTHRDGSASVQHRSMIPSPKGFYYFMQEFFD